MGPLQQESQQRSTSLGQVTRLNQQYGGDQSHNSAVISNYHHQNMQLDAQTAHQIGMMQHQ